MLFYLLERAMRMARSRGLAAGGVGLSIRYDDWKQLETRRTLPQPTAADEEVFQELGRMLAICTNPANSRGEVDHDLGFAVMLCAADVI